MERRPVTPSPEEQVHFDAWEQEIDNPEPETMTTPDKTAGFTATTEMGIEHTSNTPVSPTAEFIRQATDRLTNFLDDRAETKDDRVEARAEKINDAKEKLREIGGNALTGAREFSVISASVAFLAVESGVNSTTNFVRNKIVAFGAAARERRDYRNTHKEALAMNVRYDQETEARAMNVRFDEETEAQSINKRFDQHTEALAMNDEHDQGKKAEEDKRTKRLEALAEAKAAYARKMERKDKRKEQINNVREKAGRMFKKFGRSAIRIALRTNRAVRAGSSATRQAWNQA